MAIDPTDNETAIWLLFALGICNRDKTLICYSADFANDTSEISQCEVILKVKNAMEAGETVIMINSQSINSCFYDVFNCYFDVITGPDGKYPHVRSKLDDLVLHFDYLYTAEICQPCSRLLFLQMQSSRKFQNNFARACIFFTSSATSPLKPL